MARVIGIVLIVTVLFVFFFGYLKGRDSMTDELDELTTYTAAIEAANRLTMKAWQAATDMADIANHRPAQPRR